MAIATLLISSAFGRDNLVSGHQSSAFGYGITNNIDNSMMIGPSNSSKITILSTGEVGIGTTTPQNALHVSSGASTIARFDSSSSYGGLLIDNLSGLNSNITFGQSGAGRWEFGTDMGVNGTSDFYLYDLANSRNPFYINTDGDIHLGGISGYNNTQAMTILQGGNVGIGTYTPDNKLDIDTNVANTSGLRLKQLTSASPATATTSKALTVDANGDVILTEIQESIWSVNGNSDASYLFRIWS